MKDSLKLESEKLARSWSQHEATGLREYLVSGVENPRINVQSVFSRHFLLRALTGARFDALMTEELRFAAVMNWLLVMASRAGDPDEFSIVLHALRRGADNAEGIQIPDWVGDAFRRLPSQASSRVIPNYIEAVLREPVLREGKARLAAAPLDLFQSLWAEALAAEPPGQASVLEPGCGSANDFRFLHAYGIARLLDYTGIDVCEKNVGNARALFPGIGFEIGNVFEIAAPDQSFDLAFAHDLFEHLSLEGIQTAVAELCRVTRRGICAGFFNMDEVPEHQIQPVKDYHWNLLSMDRIRAEFQRHGFVAQVLHVATFLLRQFGCDHTHNPNAYTIVLRR